MARHDEIAYPKSRKERAVEPGRLRRAATRGVVKLADNVYRVEGKHRRHYDVQVGALYPCECEDAYFHGRNCVHELAARLASGDMALIQTLGDMLLRQEKALKEHMRGTKRKRKG